MNRQITLPGAVIFCCAFGFSFAAEKFSAEQREDGRRLAAELRELQPVETGISALLKIRPRKQRTALEIPTVYEVRIEAGRWKTTFETKATENVPAEKLVVVHATNEPNIYLYAKGASPSAAPGKLEPLAPADVSRPFAGSDFWISDLGLEFLHWPEQARLKGEMRLGQPCYVLESRDPDAPEIVRVKTWIDKESGGILIAEFYDRKNSMVKEFSLSGSSFKKINGRYQLEKMEIRSPRTGSQTILKFNLPRD